MTSSDTPADRMPWGLHLLYDDHSHEAVNAIAVDIIAVHGLGAHPDHAWVRHIDPAQGMETDVRWLTDLLPQTLREHQPSIGARIFCFNYQSAWLGKKLTKNRIENVAVRLLDAIHHVKIKDGADPEMSDRPLIFIGHSFGGLVIEQAVVTANSAGGAYQYLVNLIGGILLLGTPHQGSKSQKWGAILARLASFVEYGETVLMDDVDEKSMKIFDLVFEFMQILIRTDLAKTAATVCFYENLLTDYLQRNTSVPAWIGSQTSAIVVEETSAVLPGIHNLLLDSDHLKLNKFVSVKDGNYVTVSANLCRIAAQAPQLIQSRRKEAGAPLPSYFLVFRERVEGFVGRETELRAILSYFSTDLAALRPRSLVLHALGGQGKSQIALEYCRRSKQIYRGIFWINASSEQVAIRAYQAIAVALTRKPLMAAQDGNATIKLVTSSLEQWSERWLLVFDNLDDFKSFPSVRRFIPDAGHGDVIFTSRNRGSERLGKLLEIPGMPTEEGISLLLNGYDEYDIQQYAATASKIVNRLGGLALAIDQAAAYIRYRDISLDRLDEFLTTFESQRKKILKYTPGDFWEYGTMQIHSKTEQNQALSAFATWEMSFEQLELGDEQRQADAAHFLALSAFFDPAKIGESLFRHYWECEWKTTPPQWMRLFYPSRGESDDEDSSDDGTVDRDHRQGEPLAHWSSERFWALVAKAYNLSLLQSVSNGCVRGGASYSLHPLIRDWLQLREKIEQRRQYTQESIDIILSSVIRCESVRGTAEENLVLLAHLDACLLNDVQFSRPDNLLGHDFTSCNTASWFAIFYDSLGLYNRSERLKRVVVATQTSALGKEHSSILVSMINLAYTLEKQGKYEQAEEMLRNILKVEETTLGKDHPSILVSMNNLAEVLNSQGKYKEAEEMYRQTLGLKETTLGKGHPETLTSMNNLAEVLKNQGKYKEAEEMHRQTLGLKDTTLGKEHPDTLTSMNNLAEVLINQGKYKEAEEMHRQTLGLKETTLGKEHPDTLTSMNNLAGVLHAQGNYKEAEEMYRQTLGLKETMLGKEHPSTLAGMNNLGLVLRNQGKHKEAEEMHRQTLGLKETTLGKEHPDTLTSMNNLAGVLHAQGKYKEAEEMHRQTLGLRETTLGKEHPDTLSSMNNLASTYWAQRRWDEAESLEIQVMETRKQVLGQKHPDTLTSMNNLSYTWKSLGRDEEAIALLRQAATLQNEVLGSDHPKTMESARTFEYWLTPKSIEAKDTVV